MAIFNILTCFICMVVIIEVNSSPRPGHHHHVHHRIHVPQKIKTIHHTKIIKVPEHHHYFHEKEKIVHVEIPHHKDDIKTHFKEHKLKLHSSFDHDEDLEDFTSYHADGEYYGGKGHNIFKKHAILPKNHKRRREDESDDDDDYEEEEKEQ